jgi:glycosyltransferase involved in cell wall biosynthesis
MNFRGWTGNCYLSISKLGGLLAESSMSACLFAKSPAQPIPSLVRVSILMLTYNRPQFINRAIQSVIQQDFEDWELIVVHDGPNEAIAEILAEWARVDRRIRYFRRTTGGNIANATNFGLSHARGEYIAILDDDDYWISRTKLSKQVQFLDEHPDHVACGGGMVVLDETGKRKLRCLKLQHDADLKRWALISNPIAHSTAMFRRSLADLCGRYDEGLSGFQDWDLFLKLGQYGKFYNFPEEFIGYTLWSGGGSFAQHRNNTRSALLIVKRHGSFYRGFLPAITMASLHYAYARLPEPIRQLSFSFLSRVKKALFSQRQPEYTQPAETKPVESMLYEPTPN